MQSYTFHMPAKVVVGEGCLASLGSHIPGESRPLVLCGHRSARESGVLGAVLDQIPGALVLDGFPENPETAVCEAYAAKCRAAGAGLIIGVGGGSVLDGAKAIALLARNDGPCARYFDMPPDIHPPLPVIAIPTTAGTGSEVTPYAVLVDSAQRRKKTLKHPSLFPRTALLDACLTRTMPAAVTRATGLDALSQGMEGYVSRRSTPASDLLALEVCRQVRQALPVALRDPEDLKARGAMLYAAMLSGMVIAQTGTTLVHGMGYHYTLEHGIAHGAANALLLPPVFAWNARYLPEKVAALAGALGNPCPSTTQAAARGMVSALQVFYEEIGFARAARDHGVPEAAGENYAAEIVQDPYRFKNQVGEMTEGVVARLFHDAWEGEMDPKWSDLGPAAC